MTTFQLNPDADINGTSKVATLNTTFPELLAAFGLPQESDGYKTSGEWVFESSRGEVFTIYDWKETALYDSSFPSVSQFRHSITPTIFSVGGRGNPDEFLAFVREKMSENTIYSIAVAVLEYLEDLTTSDAQGVVDAALMTGKTLKDVWEDLPNGLEAFSQKV